MNIIILGAGQVGTSLAESLAREDNDITVVDTDATVLYSLQQRLDIRTVCGQASHPDVLSRASGEHADMLIAVTHSDEINIVACMIAQTLFQTPTKLARIRANSFLQKAELFSADALPVDVIISPECLITNSIKRLIEVPGALQVLDFAEGKVQLVAVKPSFRGPLVGKTITELYGAVPDIELRVVALYRQHRSLEVTEQTVLEVGDEMFFLTSPDGVPSILKALGRFSDPYRHVTIAGGGHIGFSLTKALESHYNIKLIDHNEERTQYLAQVLHEAMVLCGDVSDRQLLIDENIEYSDVFCAVTNDDEANIMACLQAKRLGARQVMALINRSAYADLVAGGMIDIAISPQQATIGGILTHLRRGDVANVYSLRHGAAEAIELIAHGDKKTSKVVGRTLPAIKLPPGTVIGAIVRGDELIMPTQSTVIHENDHVILFVHNKKYIGDVEKLFQVSIGFFR